VEDKPVSGWELDKRIVGRLYPLIRYAEGHPLQAIR
jgi:hypothetical protein